MADANDNQTNAYKDEARDEHPAETPVQGTVSEQMGVKTLEGRVLLVKSLVTMGDGSNFGKCNELVYKHIQNPVYKEHLSPEPFK